MRKLLVYLKDYKKECVLAPLFKMLEASFELIVPLVCASIIDVGIANSDQPYIYKMCLVLIGLALVGLASSITAQFFAAKAAVGFATQLRHALFAHIQRFSFTEIDTLGTSTMITRMTSDVNQAQTGVNMVLRLFLRSPFVVFGAMLMAFTIDVRSALIFVVAILLLFMVVFSITLVNIPMIRKVQQKLDQVLNLTRENLLGVRVIRAFCKEEDEVRRFVARNEALTKQQKKSGSISALMNPVTYVIINIAILRLIWTGTLQVEAGILTQGQVIALYNYMSQILVELIKLANLIITLNKALASGNRIADVFEMSSSMTYPEELSQKSVDILSKENGTDTVTFRHVSLNYHNAEEEALTDIDFSAKKGEIIGIIGGTGSGKSSLVNMIPRYYDATGGEVLLHGIPVRDYPEKELTRRIGMVLQKAVLFKGTIASNLQLGRRDATEAEMWDAIRVAQAEDIVKGKGGLRAKIDQGGKNLSGGQRQRMTIARALIKKPEILILDDSASALDMATDARLRAAIRELPDKPTVFIVSQRTSAIKDADQIIVLDDGRMVGRGTHDSLLTDCEVYREIYDSQYRSNTPKEAQHE
ncbi:MAG: ABC transporter ATP-binding protein [Lachnospiraceae bacterium]|nr:ABC transporter ATP-binding protein [Lachnospiraceae bacterium]